MNTQDLIHAIKDGKSSEIQGAFDSIMNEKLVQAIDSYREAVVEDIFADKEETAEE